MTEERKCLHCGETKASLKRQGIDMCGIEGGYEYRELEHEWPRHRWVDWTNAELARFGVKPEAYDRHRRTDSLTFQYIACDDTVRGHAPQREVEDIDWGLVLGQCILCGRKATLCPECVQGKHSNCIEQTLNDADEWVPCGCPEHGEPNA